MNIIHMSGGLERQMFQYAFYMKLTSMGREVKFDDISEYKDDKARPIMLSVFGLDIPRATKEEIREMTAGVLRRKSGVKGLFGKKKARIYKENGFYDPKTMQEDNMYIDGKFMSQRYFEDILPEVRKAFTFPKIENLNLPPRADLDFLIYYDAITKSESVGLHIRRSDSRFNEELYENICTVEYYRSAVNYIFERYPEAKIFMFSNEPKWIKNLVRDIIKGFVNEDMDKDEIRAIRDRFVLVEANDDNTSYLDMFLLGQCKHHILSNSSFSWWGAWMNQNPDKITIAPNIWLNGVDSGEIYTEGMILINSKGRVEKKVK